MRTISQLRKLGLSKRQAKRAWHMKFGSRGRNKKGHGRNR